MIASAIHTRDYVYPLSTRAKIEGDRLCNAVDWKQFGRLSMPDACRYLALRAKELGYSIPWDTNDNDLSVSERALSTPIISSAINTEIGSRVVTGFGAIRDTTAGLVTEVPSATFLQSETYTVEETTRLHKRARGREAEHTDFVAVPTPRTLADYAAQLRFDEQSIIDSQTTGGAWLEGFTELGRAARRTMLDLVWSTILKNPPCYDSVATFHATHGNKLSGGSSPLSATSLPTACQYLAQQVFLNDGRPVHASLRPTHLIVPPALEETGRSLCRLRMLDNNDDNLSLVVENRISAKGVLDPTDDATVITGSDTLWFVAAAANQRPAVILSYLEGSSTSPTIRTFSLQNKGQWGMGWDISLRIGCSIQDWRSWVQSAGA